MWWVYIVQTLHGINFGVGFAVETVYLQQIGEIYSDHDKGVNIKATAQSLKGIIVLCRGISGSIMWLPIYEHFQAQTVYVLGALTLIPSTLALWRSRSFDNRLLNVNCK